MKFQTKRKNSQAIDYWQAIADLLAALLLVVLLIVMILVLYVIQLQKVDFTNHFPEEHTQDELSDESDDSGDDWNDHLYDHEHDFEKQEDSGGSGQGFDFPETGKDERFGKSAVYVMVIDAETDRTIKEEDVVFELYNAKNELQLLNTYFPEKIEYRNYYTTADGVFYLPEKIRTGAYYLHELTEPKGYDMADNQYFDIDDAYDWPNPFIVKVPLYPSKNIIRIKIVDASTGETVTGGIYDVVAAEAIMTEDGTLRCGEGQVADQIIIDENGYGESVELFLGNYIVRQSTVPRYYASDLEQMDVTVAKKTPGILPNIHENLCEKTTVEVTLTDELYENIPLAGVPFRLSCPGNPALTRTLETDVFGKMTVTDLNKNTSYYLEQLDVPAGYRMPEGAFSIQIDTSGRQGDAARVQVPVTNRTLRVSVGITDMILRNQITDQNLALYGSDGTLVATWDSMGLPKTLEGLEPGEYSLVINGKENTKKQFTLVDVKDVQHFNAAIWTNADIAAIAVGGGIGAAAVVIIIFLLLRAKRKKQETE